MGDVVDFELRPWQRDMNKLLDEYEATMDLAKLLEAIDLADKHDLEMKGGHAILIEEPEDVQE